MGSLSSQPMLFLQQNQVKRHPFHCTQVYNDTQQRLTPFNAHLFHGTSKSRTRFRGRARSPPSKTRISTPNLPKRRLNPGKKFTRKSNPRPEKTLDRQKQVIPGYGPHSKGQKSMATVYRDLKLLCREGQLNEAISVLSYMDFRKGDIPVDANIYDFLIHGCTVEEFLEGGKKVHEHMKMTGSDRNIYLATKLVKLYTACDRLEEAQKAFDAVPEPKNLFLWNSIIRAYVRNGFYEKRVIELYDRMRISGIRPDNFTFSCVLKACGSLRDLMQGMEIHGEVIRSGFESDVVVGGALVDMYSRCDCPEFASQVFEESSERNVVNWSAMVSGFVHNSWWEEALGCFGKMVVEGCRPNSITVSSVLPACGILGALREGKEIHGYAVRSELDSYLFVAGALITMYMKCGCVENARRVFDKMPQRNVVACSAMISGYQKNGRAEEALQMFRQMHGDGVKPNLITMVNVLPACVDLATLQQGKEIHAYIIKHGFLSSSVLCNALIEMYSKCGSVEDGYKVFDEICEKEDSFWATMIAAYKIRGRAEEALTVFYQMQKDGVKPNLATMLNIISLCSDLAVLQEGQKIHGYAIKCGFDSNVFVCSALIEMYGKYGFVEIADKVFDTISERGVVSWTSIILTHGINGCGEKALELFNNMQEEDVMPNYYTIFALLTACSNAGLFAEGWQYFNSMNQDYNIQPRVEHYACMVDLLGRAGQLYEARIFIQNMPIKPDATVWRALLGACRNHCNVEIGDYAANSLMKLEPLNFGDFMALASIYAEAGRWDNVAKVRAMMKCKGLKGEPEWSGVVVKNRIHKFVRGDKSHLQLEEICVTFERIIREIKAVGLTFEPNNVPQVEEEDGEYIFCGHSETLALTLGLINSSPGKPIQIVQNLRMCRYCHSITKAISKITGQKIILRDDNCIHHFKGGECACQDYW